MQTSTSAPSVGSLTKEQLEKSLGVTKMGVTLAHEGQKTPCNRIHFNWPQFAGPSLRQMFGHDMLVNCEILNGGRVMLHRGEGAHCRHISTRRDEEGSGALRVAFDHWGDDGAEQMPSICEHRLAEVSSVEVVGPDRLVLQMTSQPKPPRRRRYRHTVNSSSGSRSVPNQATPVGEVLIAFSDGSTKTYKPTSLAVLAEVMSILREVET